MKMLTVDDSSIIRKIIRATADILQIELEEAQDGYEALDKITEIHHELDLVLLDWNMPGLSGYDVLVEMKGNDDYKHIPVMMVTAEGDKANITAAVKAGAAAYLTKPFSMDELIEKITECVGEGGSI